MNKKVDEEFVGIKDVYVLQCICTELNKTRKKAIEYCKSYSCWEDEDGTFNETDFCIDDLLNILQGDNDATN